MRTTSEVRSFPAPHAGGTMATLIISRSFLIVLSLLSLLGSTAHAGARQRAPISSDSNVVSPRHRHGLPMNRRVRSDGSIVYDNWSGFLVTGTAGSITDVKGSWKVPPVTCTPPNSTYSSAWVGIDMESNS